MTQELRGYEAELSGVRNFRDVGGLPTTDGRRVRLGRLYRSGHLAHATTDDAGFLSGLGLRTIFDFRNEVDIDLEGPDIDLPGVRYRNLPLTDPADGAEFWSIVQAGDLAALRAALGDGQAVDQMVTSYRAIIVERTAEHGELLRVLSEEDDGLPVLLHCAAGKDRAGLAIVVILLALGVHPAAIEADYLASNAAHRRYRIKRATGASMAPEVMELISPLFEARVEYLDAALKSIRSTWGSLDGYLQTGLGCGPGRRDRLREKLLDPA